MKIESVNKFELHRPMSGGKAGTGLNKTSTIQVRQDGFIIKQFRFKMANGGYMKALERARDFALIRGRAL